MRHASFSRLLRAPMAAALVLLAGCSANDAGPVADASGPTIPGNYTETSPPPVRHVFIIVLENKGYDGTFGPASPAPYLSQTLPSKGQLLTHYYGIGHLSLDNYIAMVSGQGPNPMTQSDCQGYMEFIGGIPPGAPDGQAIGTGCVYPAAVKTIADQLEPAGFTWRTYAEDMALGTPATCRHPDLNSQDHTQTATATDQYATRHVPFMYFHTIIDDQPRCDANAVDLAQLDADLVSVTTTPNYVFITPDLCSTGHDEPCADETAGGGYAGIEAFLSTWVPKILSSPAFLKDGLLIVTFDEAESDPNDPTGSDASACCGEMPGPNSPMPGIFGLGGGRVGAVVISPFVEAGTVNDTPYNHYSMLRSVENLFGLTYLGYAGQSGLKAFGSDVYNVPH